MLYNITHHFGFVDDAMNTPSFDITSVWRPNRHKICYVCSVYYMVEMMNNLELKVEGDWPKLWKRGKYVID